MLSTLMARRTLDGRLAPLVDACGYSSLAVGAAGSIIVTDTPSNVLSIAEVIAELDVAGAERAHGSRVPPGDRRP